MISVSRVNVATSIAVLRDRANKFRAAERDASVAIERRAISYQTVLPSLCADRDQAAAAAAAYEDSIAVLGELFAD